MTKKWIAITLLLLVATGLLGWRLYVAVRQFNAGNDLSGIQPVQEIKQKLTERNLSMRDVRWTMSITPLLLIDDRFAHLPALNFTLPYMIPVESNDIERIEVVRGPGSVLYGPDSAEGVIHVITRSPFESAGTSVSVLGGTREMLQGTIRHAAVIGERLAVQVSARWFSGHDWEYTDPVEQENRAAAIADRWSDSSGISASRAFHAKLFKHKAAF